MKRCTAYAGSLSRGLGCDDLKRGDGNGCREPNVLMKRAADALESLAVSTPPTITDEAAAFDSAIRGVEAWHSDDERIAAQYAGVREGLIRGREIALRRFCVCTPAIAGISDGPNVGCPVHGETREGAF